MIIDLQTTLSGTTSGAGVKTGQALTATAISEHVIDLRPQNGAPTLVDEALSGPDLWLVVQVQTSAAGGDAAKTLTITLESAADAGLTSGPVVHASTAAITGATLAAGYTAWRIPLPAADYKRYLGLRYTVSAGFTAFNLLAYLTANLDRNKPYPSGFTV